MSASNRYLIIKALPVNTGAAYINTSINKRFPVDVVVEIIDQQIKGRFENRLLQSEIDECFKQIPSN